MARRPSLTIEDILDEDNKDALAALEKTASSSPSRSKKSSQRSQYVGNALTAPALALRHSSIAGEGQSGVTSPGQSRKKRLDPSDPSTWTTRHSVSDPPEPKQRSYSETQSRTDVPSISFDEDKEADGTKSKVDDNLAIAAQVAVAQAPARAQPILSGYSAATIQPGQPEARRSISSATYAEPASPDASKNLSPPSSPEMTRDGGDRRGSNISATYSATTDDSDQIGPISRDDDDVLQESSEEEGRSSSDEDSPVTERGRKRRESRETSSPSPTASRELETPASPEPPQIKVDEAADPNPHPVEKSGKLSETKGYIVAPRSNYRSKSPAAVSMMGDDDAELKRAKALGIKVSAMDELIKDRSVKMMVRGDWEAFQDFEDEDQQSRHEPRLYMVCTDLSLEATFALEWTVGTLLRDGDTLLLMNAIEDENAPKGKDFEAEPSLEIKLESAKAAEEASATMENLTRQTTNQHSDAQYEESRKQKLAVLKGSGRSLSRTGRNWTKQDETRIKAIDKLESDFLKFVRKTTLQVRCMFEVIHCRSPRHLILNAIDTLEPTLVVVGTRGLGTVRNVVMGSFSNYLVQKSSVPVMVARKRLKKPHHAKVSSDKIRMTNNLNPFSLGGKRKSLTQARID